MMPTEQADRSTRVYSAVGIGRELRTSNFLLALMAAAAKSTRSDLDEAEERIEELEKDAEIVSEEFEGDCWKAVRTLLERVGWTDFSEGVTAQDACEIIGDAIHESRSQALTAERDGLREGVKTLATQAEHGSFTACMAADPEAVIVALGEQFFAIKEKARALLTPPAPHSDEAGS